MLNDFIRNRLVIALFATAIFVTAGGVGMAEADQLSLADRTGRITGTFYRDYPLRFSGRGGIDRVGDQELVIDDTLNKLSAGVMCNTPLVKNAPYSTLNEDDIVGFITNAKGEITSLWVLENIGDLVDE